MYGIDNSVDDALLLAVAAFLIGMQYAPVRMALYPAVKAFTKYLSEYTV